MAIREAIINVNARKGDFAAEVTELLGIAKTRKVTVEVEAKAAGGSAATGKGLSLEGLEDAQNLIANIETRLAALAAKPVKITLDFGKTLDRLEAALSGVGGRAGGGGGGGGRKPKEPRTGIGGRVLVRVDSEEYSEATYEQYRKTGQYTAEQQLKRKQEVDRADSTRSKALDLREKRLAQQERSIEVREKNLQSASDAAEARALRTQASKSRAQKSSARTRADDSEEASAYATYRGFEGFKAHQRKLERESPEAIAEREERRATAAANRVKAAAKRKEADARNVERQQSRIDAAVKEFGESSQINEFGAFVGGLFHGSVRGDDSAGARRVVQRAINAKEFTSQQRFRNLPGLEAALAGAKTPSLLNFKNLTRPEVAQQIGFGGVFGGLPGIAATAVGGLVGGLPGALAASTIQQTIQGVLIDPIVHAFTERKAEFEEAGKAYSQSILGVQSSLQATTTVVGRGGSPAGLGASLAFQEKQATDIQLAARKRLLPLGIAGQTEATFVQGIQQAAASRGLNLSAKGLAEVAGIFGGGIVSQRRSLLDNPNLLLRDVQDYVTGGALSKRTILSQLGGFRQASTAVGNATTEEEFLKAIRPIGSFEQTVRNSGNIASIQQRLEGAQDQLRTVAGTELLNTIKEPLSNLAKNLGAEDTENTFKNLGRIFGEVSAAGINFTSTMTGLGNSFNQAISPIGGVIGAIGGLVDAIGGSTAGADKAAQKFVDAKRESGAVGSKVSDAQLLQNLFTRGGFGDKVTSYEQSLIENPSALLAGLERAEVTIGKSPDFQQRLPGILAAKLGLQESEFKDRSRIFQPGGAAGLALEQSSIRERLNTLNELAAVNGRSLSASATPTPLNLSAELKNVQKLTKASNIRSKQAQEEFDAANALNRPTGTANEYTENLKSNTANVLGTVVNTFLGAAKSVGFGKQAGEIRKSLGVLGVSLDQPGAPPSAITQQQQFEQATKTQLEANRLAEQAHAQGAGLVTKLQDKQFGSAAFAEAATASIDSEQKILELRRQELQVVEKQSEIVRSRFEAIGSVFQGAGAQGNFGAAAISGAAANRQLDELDRQRQQREITRSQIEGFQSVRFQPGKLGQQGRDLLDKFRGQDLEAAKLELSDQDRQTDIAKALAIKQRTSAYLAQVGAIGDIFGEEAGQFNTESTRGQLAIASTRQRGALLQRDLLTRSFAKTTDQRVEEENARRAGLGQAPVSGIERESIALGRRQEGVQINRSAAEAQAQSSVRDRLNIQLNEEVSKRAQLNSTLEASKLALTGFKTHLESAYADKGEQILSAADEVRKLGGYVPSELNVSDEQRQQFKLGAASSRLAALSAETGLSQTGTQGQTLLSAGFLPRSQFDYQQQSTRQGLETSILGNQKSLFDFEKSTGSAFIPGAVQLPADAGGINDLIQKNLPDLEKLNQAFSGGSDEKKTDGEKLAADVQKVLTVLLELRNQSGESNASTTTIASNTAKIAEKLEGDIKVKTSVQ